MGTHVAWRSRDGAAGVRSRAAVGQVGPPPELVEGAVGVGRELPVKEGLPAREFGVIDVTTRKMKQPLEVPRGEQPAPRAVIGVGKTAQDLGLTSASTAGNASPG